MKRLTAIITFSASLLSPVAAQAPITKSMSFDACIALIQHTSTKLGIAPVNIVETSILRIVRFPAEGGSVLLTCSGPDNKAIIQETRNECGVDVNC